MRPIVQGSCVLSGALLVIGCAESDGVTGIGFGMGGTDSDTALSGGSTAQSAGTSRAEGGNTGVTSSGRSSSSAAKTATGGRNGSGGETNTADQVGAGGKGTTRSTKAMGGAATGGRATGGFPVSRSTATGGAAVGSSKATSAVATGGGSSTSTLDCSAIPTMPTGGTEHCGQNTQGNAGGEAWSLWCNSLSSSACMTTFNSPAFSARWNNNSDFLARVGLEFGNSAKTWSQYGTLKADFAFTKSGSAGGYSYIGIYGWTNNPCVEWYIVDDRYGTMPFDAYNSSQKGTVTIDGESYKLFQNKTNGTGGSRCTGATQWDQYWSIRQKARQCGTITISEHFKAWEAAGLKMGVLLEAKILVETGGGTGSINFPLAKVTAQ